MKNHDANTAYFFAPSQKGQEPPKPPIRTWVSSINMRDSKRVNETIDLAEDARPQICLDNALVRLMEKCITVLPRHPQHFSYTLMAVWVDGENPVSSSGNATIAGPAQSGNRKGLGISHIFKEHSFGTSYFNPINLLDPLDEEIADGSGHDTWFIAKDPHAKELFKEARVSLAALLAELDGVNPESNQQFDDLQIIMAHLDACVVMLHRHCANRDWLVKTEQQRWSAARILGQVDTLTKAGESLGRLLSFLGLG